MSDKTYGFETLSVHAGAAPDPTTGARALPIYQTTAYVFEDADHAAALFNLQTVGFIYSRLTNPTNAALETRLATLEGGRGCTVASSGHAAQVLALFPLMSPGAEIVASSRLYGGSLQQMRNTYPKFGWAAKIVDADEPENFKRAVGANTKAFFIESLANPGGVISDIEAIARIAESAGVPLLVDNTLATPWLCKPIDYGATLIVHSTTKFLSGNGTSMGGAVVDSGKFDWANGKFP
ncbi:MAG: O-acetylhomoserine (thiol)-lyase, partial [Rhodospirillaceae bacterium]|nr:O-acetylhomoserine (thiol)-lyase [Rhodospirillaceae bacterium]